MAELFRSRIEQRPLPIRLGIVFELQCIPAHKDFCRADKSVQHLLVILKQRQIHTVRRVTAHQKQDRNRPLIAARSLQIVGQILEDQALIQGPERGRQLSEIVRRSDDQPILGPALTAIIFLPMIIPP